MPDPIAFYDHRAQGTAVRVGGMAAVFKADRVRSPGRSPAPGPSAAGSSLRPILRTATGRAEVGRALDGPPEPASGQRSSS
jgi:hypothetical protein